MEELHETVNDAPLPKAGAKGVFDVVNFTCKDSAEKFGIEPEALDGVILSHTITKDGILTDIVDYYHAFMFRDVKQDEIKDDLAVVDWEEDMKSRIGDEVEFYPMARQMKRLEESSPELFEDLDKDERPHLKGTVESITLTRAKVLYNIRCAGNKNAVDGSIFKKIDSTYIKKATS